MYFCLYLTTVLLESAEEWEWQKKIFRDQSQRKHGASDRDQTQHLDQQSGLLPIAIQSQADMILYQRTLAKQMLDLVI